MNTIVHIRPLVGLADTCELVSRLFRFPSHEVANAFASGAIRADAVSCLTDAGVDPDEAHEAAAPLRRLEGMNPADLYEALRHDASLLFWQPDPDRRVWLYESAFMHAASGSEAAPILFRSPTTIDVERMMAEAGVRMRDARREPCDSVSDELSFLSYAYGTAAQALWEGDEEGAAAWCDTARAFTKAHPARWLPAFMAAVAEAAQQGQETDVYRACAAIGSAALTPLLDDAQVEWDRCCA